MTLGCGVLFKKTCILFKSPSLGLWCLTKYLQSITRLCSVVDFSGSLAPLVLDLRLRPPRHRPSPSLLRRPSPRPLRRPSLSPLRHPSLCPLRRPSLCLLRRPVLFVVVILLVWWLWGSIRGRVVRYRVVGCVVAQVALSWRWSYCRGGGRIFVAVVVLSLSWLGCLGGGYVAVAFAPSSSWLRCRRGVVALVIHALGLAALHSTRMALPCRCVIHGWGFAVVRHVVMTVLHRG